MKTLISKMLANSLYYSCTLIFVIYYKYMCRCTISGEHHIVKNLERGFVIAANHSSYLDWVVLHLLFLHRYNVKLSFIAKAKVLDHFFWQPIVSKCNCIRVNRKGRLSKSHQSQDLLAKQKYVVIFPEGTRTPKGNFVKAKTGVAKISVQHNLPVIPTGLVGFFEAWPRHEVLPRPHKLQVKFGRPLDPMVEELNETNLKRKTKKIMSSIGELKGEKYRF